MGFGRYKNRKAGYKEPLAEKVGFLVTENGEVMNRDFKQIKTHENFNTGYLSFSFSGYNVLVHRFVWHMHRGPIPEGMVIDHINRQRNDPRLENLRCVTQSENMKNKQCRGIPWWAQKQYEETLAEDALYKSDYNAWVEKYHGKKEKK